MKAAEMLKNILASNLVLIQPDPEQPFTLEVDASAFATGAILYQKDKQTGKLRPVGYHSQTFNPAE